MSLHALDRPAPATMSTLRRNSLVVTVVSLLVAAALWLPGQLDPHSQAHRHSVLNTVTIDWPDQGEAAIAVIGAGHRASSPAPEVPIASVAKVMTAYVVLRGFPLHGNEPGFAITLSPTDAEQAISDKAEGQSTVPVEAGEVLTERQALEALLLPSANNIAHVLAAQVAGGESAFVRAMNVEAQRLGMRHTTYTDPSGLDPATTSTAADQLRLAEAAMRVPAFAAIVAMPTATLPVAGTVHNTDTLLGHDGFVGIKTGSTNDAGGCFMFEVRQRDGGRMHTVVGVVLGQHGGPLIHAGLAAGHDLADDVTAQLAHRR